MKNHDDQRLILTPPGHHVTTKAATTTATGQQMPQGTNAGRTTRNAKQKKTDIDISWAKG
jgi:hypothetical protein